jgi:sulfate adenylyltransferase subunit 1 (EFTu-like GTPase family)
MFHLSKNSIKVGDELLLRIATQEIKVKILEILRKMDSSTLNELDKSNGMVELNQVAEVLLESEKPTVFDDFNFCPELGRFVLEQDNIAVSAGIIRL